MTQHPTSAPSEDSLDLVDTGCDEAGAAVLGSALYGSPDARSVVSVLRADDLTDTRQRAVLVAMHPLIRRGAPIDPVTVVGEMRAQGSSEARLPAGRDAGVYIADLMERGMTGAPRFHLRVILEHGVRRAARAAGTRITQAAGSMPVDDLAAFVADQTAVVQLAEKRRDEAS